MVENNKERCFLKDQFIRLSKVSKQFAYTKAVDNVTLEIGSPIVTCLVGGNGSGKSTLLKILSGDIRADSGEIRIGKEKVFFNHPLDALNRGISMVYQDDQICLDLTILENILLGTEPIWNICGLEFWNYRKAELAAQEIIEKIRRPLPQLNAVAQSLSGGQRKVVALARALLRRPRFLMLDEPTNSLGVEERNSLFLLINKLKGEGVSIVYVSHDVKEILALADRIIAMKRGKIVFDKVAIGMGKEELLQLMASTT